MNVVRNLLIILLSFVTSYASSQEGVQTHQKSEIQEYKLWRAQRLKEFESYKEQLNQEFKQYKKVQEEQLALYRKSIESQWDIVEISQPKKWVEYSPDRTTKRVVDYEKNEIRIHTIEKKGLDVGKEMERELRGMLSERVDTAFQREPVIYNTDKAIVKESAVVITTKPDNSLVLEELFDDPEPTTEQIRRKTSELIKNSVIHKQTAKKSTTGQETQATVITIPLPKGRPSKKAALYRNIVKKYAIQWKLDDALVLAVIHTESAFNPMATSYIPAYGMMQIVPKYSGIEVSKKLWGKPKLLAPSYLYNAEKNIEIGVVYLNLLYYQYFRQVKDPESRLYCTISAYNTGPGNVARTFNGKSRSLAKAIPIINKMKPSDIYKHLRNNLPYEETRDYLQRVSQRMKTYQEWGA